MLKEIDYAAIDFARQSAIRIIEDTHPKKTQLALLEEAVCYLDLLINNGGFADTELEFECNYSIATRKVINRRHETYFTFSVKDGGFSMGCFSDKFINEETNKNAYDEFTYNLE